MQFLHEMDTNVFGCNIELSEHFNAKSFTVLNRVILVLRSVGLNCWSVSIFYH